MRKHPKQRLPLSPAAQLSKVIEAVCDDALEAEILLEEEQGDAADPAGLAKYDRAKIAMEKRAELGRFAVQYREQFASKARTGQATAPLPKSSAPSADNTSKR